MMVIDHLSITGKAEHAGLTLREIEQKHIAEIADELALGDWPVHHPRPRSRFGNSYLGRHRAEDERTGTKS